MSLARILRGRDERFVSVPVGSNVFKVAGGGQNYVHGGSSPQEMLVPVIRVRMEKGHMETKRAGIALLTNLKKVTNQIVMLNFIQSDAVSDVVKATTYRMYFVSEDKERVSKEQLYIADSRDPDAKNRMFSLTFQFKDQAYSRSKGYFFVILDDAAGVEVFRLPVVIDLAFSGDYRF